MANAAPLNLLFKKRDYTRVGHRFARLSEFFAALAAEDIILMDSGTAGGADIAAGITAALGSAIQRNLTGIILIYGNLFSADITYQLLFFHTKGHVAVTTRTFENTDQKAFPSLFDFF